jgi:site-specific recombinase XerD
MLTEQRIVRWMTLYASRRTPSTTAQAFQVVNRYLASIADADLAKSNPMAAFKIRHGNASWHHIARVLQSDQPEAALAVLRRIRVRHGPLKEHIWAYIDLHRAVGKSYRTNHHVLHELDRFLASQAAARISSVSKRSMECWLEQMTCSTAHRVRKARMAKQFFAHLVTQGVIPRNPMGDGLEPYGRLAKASFKPFIYTKEQVSAILAQAKRLLKSHLFPLRPHVCYTFIAVLYALGLRPREARLLRIGDLDLEQNVLLVHETKFHKSRMVPFGPRLASCLRRYLRIRLTVLQPAHGQDPLFVTLWRRPISPVGINQAFRQILNEVGLGTLNDRERPRMHDLRHTFAVHRLLRWYRQGVDVQSRLMSLATFMGHVEIRSTEVYLMATTELLNEANARFHRRFGNRISAEGRS